MDLRETTRPVLYPLVEELLGDERLTAFADALPAPARVSEPALPLLLAALHEHLARALVVVLPEDADARDAAEGARWFLGEERVALLPSRGVRWGGGPRGFPGGGGGRVAAGRGGAWGPGAGAAPAPGGRGGRGTRRARGRGARRRVGGRARRAAAAAGGAAGVDPARGGRGA